MPLKTPHFWYRPYGLMSALLQPFSWCYQVGEWMNRSRAVPKAIDVPVIAVGNAVAGGGGKTPMTIALIHLLRKMGYTPHVVTRGYGRTQKQLLQVDPAASSDAVGDEPLLLARHAPTWVFANRYKAAEMAMHAGANVIVMDDGLQHYTLSQDIRLCCISGEDGFGNGACLPAGPLRQPVRSLLPTLSAAIVMGKTSGRTRMQLGESVPRYNANYTPLNWKVKDKAIIAFAGIARPQRFFDMLEREGAQVKSSKIFADHHRYSEKELDALARLAEQHDAQLVTTAKDHVRLPAAWRERVLALDITLNIPEEEALAEQLQQRLAHIYNKAA